MKVLKSAWKLLILIALIVFGLLYYASNKVDAKYQSAIEAMNNGEWSKAVGLLSETPHYKEASELYIYMYPHKLFYSGYTTEEDAIKGYSNAVDFIEHERDKLKGTDLEKYISDIDELEKVLNFKIKELNAKILDEPLKKNLDDGVQLIKSGNYQEALLKLQLIDDNCIYGTDKKELVKYISLLTVIPTNDLKTITSTIKELNPNYSGTLSQEIKLTVQSYIEPEQWNEMYSDKKEEKPNKSKVDKAADASENPEIKTGTHSRSVTEGMKREDVIAILGNPSSSNKISNKYGNYEEMVYGNNSFVYIEDNIVKAVK